MYWIYSILFILAVLTPDIVSKGYKSLPETNLEELVIFFFGITGFIVFIFKERKLYFYQKEQEKRKKKLQQTSRDLVDSYSYIGEINRKMEILMQIGLGLADRSNLNKKKEQEIYKSIIEAAGYLIKADCVCLRFVELKNMKILKEI